MNVQTTSIRSALAGDPADTVLVVDDDTENLAILGRLLGSRYNVLAAGTGQRALEIVAAGLPRTDLILLDVVLPGMSGLDLLEELRGESRVPVILISGRRRPADRARADELGVRFHDGRVDAVHQRAGFVEAAGLRADWLLGADGLHSTVARETGLALPAPAARRRFGQRRHYALPPWSEFVEVLWTPAGEFYVTPIGDGTVGIALLAARGEHFDAALAATPSLSERLRGVAPASELRGAGPLRQRTRGRVAGRVLLVGDASGYVDALTGEGLRIGFAQARAAVSALVAGRPDGYESAWERETRDFRRLTGALVRLAASPLRGAVVPVAARLPGVFAGAVERLAR